MTPRKRAALAGASAATAWGLLEPLDRRVFRCDYSDIALLGKAVTRGRGWRPIGFAIHVANGTAFGLAFHEVRARIRADPRRLAPAAPPGGHGAPSPLPDFLRPPPPARGQHGVPPPFPSPRPVPPAEPPPPPLRPVPRHPPR